MGEPSSAFLWYYALVVDLHALRHGPTEASHTRERGADSTGVAGAAGEYTQHDVSQHRPAEEEVQNDRRGDSGETQYVSLQLHILSQCSDVCNQTKLEK